MELAFQTQFTEIQKVIKSIDSGESLSREKCLSYIELLETYECWRPCFRLLKRSTQAGGVDSFDYFVTLARIQASSLDDVGSCTDTCSNMIRTLGLSFAAFKDQVIANVLPSEAWESEAIIFEAVGELFPEKSDRVLCVERLCSLYEKKVHNERKLHGSFERLIKLDPRNIKALRYLKLAFTQNNDWDGVVGILKRLMNVAIHKQELFRYAQELAAIYLYQLDNPQEAIATLEERCSESPLDGSMIHFDAYQRMGNVDGCIRVLRNCLINVDQNLERAIIHYKIAELEEQLGRLEIAATDYATAAQLAPDLLEPLEGLLQVQMRQTKWAEVLKTLDLLKTRVIEKPLAQRIDEAKRRLHIALERVNA